MRITGDIKFFRSDDFKRSLANLLDTEPRYINLIYYSAGSVITYFYISSPTPIVSEVDKPIDIRSLSGNEKTLLLYQWYVTNDPRLSQLPFHIIDYQLYYDDILPDGNSTVVQLFVPVDAPPVNPIIPTRIAIDNGQIEIRPAIPVLRTVINVPLPVGSSSTLTMSLIVQLVVAIALFGVTLM